MLSKKLIEAVTLSMESPYLLNIKTFFIYNDESIHCCFPVPFWPSSSSERQFNYHMPPFQGRLNTENKNNGSIKN